MVRMSGVWDRTTAVLSGRGSMLAGIALVTMFVPAIVQAGVSGFGESRAFTGVIGVVANVILLFGVLAVTAVASDPATTRSRAYEVASRRFPLAIGLVLLVALVFLALALVATMIAVVGGLDMQALARMARSEGAASADTIAMPAGSGVLVLVSLAFLAIAVWIGARLSVLYGAIVNEPAGVATLRNAFDATRGLVWRIIGVILLYVVVLGVSFLAATLITGIVARLVAGPDDPALATFLVAIVAAVVMSIFTVLQTVFAAQLYVAIRESATPTP